MAKIKPTSAKATLRFSSFEGITPGKGFGDGGASLMQNFCILADGSLEKRCGWETSYAFSGVIRGFWEGSIEGTHYHFIVIGSRIYRYNAEAQTATTVSYLSTSVGDTSFAFYHGYLYFFDGTTILRFIPSSTVFTEAIGYIPLYGMNWHPTQMGSVHEELNLLQPKIRINYLNTTASTTFQLPFPAQQIDRMYINKTVVTNYSFVSGSSTFSIPSSLASGVVEVHLTLSSLLNQRATVCKAFRTQVIHTSAHEILFSHGGTPGYRLYYSKPVTDEMLLGSRTVFTSSDPLYFPSGQWFLVGDHTHPLTALCLDRERLLAANDRNVWGIEFPSSKSEAPEIFPISCGVGCISPGGLLRFGRNLLTVQESGIYFLTDFETDSARSKAVRISDALEEELSPSVMDRLIVFWRQGRDEIWVRDPEEATGKVWVYNVTKKHWVCHNGISSVCFFESNGRFGFFQGNGKMCFFDEALETDDGNSFTAVYRSHFLALPTPEATKRSVSVVLGGYTDFSGLSLSIETERNNQTFLLQGRSNIAPKLFDLRWSPGRFRSLRWSVSHSGTDRCRICFLSVSVNS